MGILSLLYKALALGLVIFVGMWLYAKVGAKGPA